ncbi:MAG: PAS domain S-box protein [Pseudomonadaceae bacterium]
MPVNSPPGRNVLLYFFLIWLPLTLLTVAVTAALLHNHRVGLREAAALEQKAQVQAAKSLLSDRLNGIQADILYLAGQLQLLDTPEQAAATFTTFQQYHGQYYQIRLLDIAGQEQVRVQLLDGQPQVIPASKLQDKSHRYYFQLGLAQPAGSVYLSPFDLNMEHGDIQRPFQPTIRIATPIADVDGNTSALLVINYRGQGLLDALAELDKPNGASLWLVNANGYWLKGDSAEQTWGFMLPERSNANLSQQQVTLWSQMIRADSEGAAQTDSASYRFASVDFDPRSDAPLSESLGTLYLVSQLTDAQLDGANLPARLAFWQAACFIILLLALLALLLARAVAQRRASESSLISSESLFRAMIEAAPDAIVITDSNGNITLLNEQAMVMFDYSQQELLGQKVEVLIPTQAAKRHVKHREGYVREAQPRPMGMGLSLSAQRKDGSQLPVEISLSPIHTPDGQLVFCAIRDATERRAAERKIRQLNEGLARQNTELQAVNRELEAFSYSVSHDLRAPLRAIDGFSKILQGSLEGQLSAQDDDYFNRIRKAAQNMSKLIDDLLMLARVTRADVTLANLDLTRMATGVVERLRESHPERSIEVSIEPNLRVSADPALLQVALENLLSNAFKFTGTTENPRIEVGRLAEQQEDIIYVRDNGVGFDMSYADKLFTPFQRLHSARDFPGTGIGLASIGRIMSKLGGRVWAESVVGQGATFYLQFKRLETES